MARNSEKNQQLRDQSIEKIIAAALIQFSKKGLFATRIQDIANEAGISQGLLYRYFPSKEAIYVALVEEALDLMNQKAEALLAMKMTAKEKILMTLDAMYTTIETSERYRQTSRLIAEGMSSEAVPTEAKLALKAKRTKPYEIFEEILRQGQMEGDILQGNPHDLAILFWSTLNGLTVYQTSRDEARGLPDKAFIARMFIKE